MLDRLRRALAGSAEQPRPVAEFELPLNLGHLITPAAVAKLKPAAVLVPILRRETGDTVLLTRRADTLRQHKGQISFPGGRRDDSDPSLAYAALREAEEEVGLAREAVELIGYLDDYPTFTGYCITPVVGVITGEFTPRTDPGEVAETFELPLELVLDEHSFARKMFPSGGMNLPFYELHYGGHRIWGATAGILHNLRKRVLAHD